MLVISELVTKCCLVVPLLGCRVVEFAIMFAIQLKIYCLVKSTDC